MHTPILLNGFLCHAMSDPLILTGGQGRLSLETVTSDDGHRHTDLYRLPVAMPCNRQRQSMLKLSLFLPRARAPKCSNFLGMQVGSLAHWACLYTGSGDSALYFFGDRRCADRQRHLVIDEGKLMGENVLPHLGIQQALTSNQSIDGAQ
jgi:hypothetical protein